MIVKLLTEHHLEFLSLKGGRRGPSESTHDKMPHCWKSHALAQFSEINFEELTFNGLSAESKISAIFSSAYCNRSAFEDLFFKPVKLTR